MKPYPNGKGEWIDHEGIRVEVYANGSWVVYTINPLPFRCIASSDRGMGKDLEGAKELARKAYLELRSK